MAFKENVPPTRKTGRREVESMEDFCSTGFNGKAAPFAYE
jgi:hypothetical protein